MNYENPTRARIGMHGNFGGKDYRVLGRVVMGETEDGETYYWNEFNLHGDDGSYADLVYEQTERGGEWRLFTMFEPEYPVTAADAATKRVGDRINLTGEDVRVTFVGSSRVYHIEGKAPEDVEVGDVAKYFNAETGRDMQVVSWTGEDVEYYNGVAIPQNVVASAFNLPRTSEAEFFTGSGSSSWLGSNTPHYDIGVKFLLKGALVLFFFIVIFGRNISCSMDSESAPVKKVLAGVMPLTVGATGKILDRNYHITAHAVMEIAEVGLCYERHEYELTDDNGRTAVLVCGLKPEEKDWHLFESVFVIQPPKPQECAAKKTGDILKLEGTTATVRELFLSTTRQAESAGPTDLHTGDVRFGFEADAGGDPLLVSWTVSTITIQRGKNISPKDTAAALATPAK
jgi:hypothetical protein